MHTCRHCGAIREPDAASALAWARERDPDGREQWLCPACARCHVRDIEAKLPPEWWGRRSEDDRPTRTVT